MEKAAPFASLRLVCLEMVARANFPGSGPPAPLHPGGRPPIIRPRTSVSLVTQHSPPP